MRRSCPSPGGLRVGCHACSAVGLPVERRASVRQSSNSEQVKWVRAGLEHCGCRFQDLAGSVPSANGDKEASSLVLFGRSNLGAGLVERRPDLRDRRMVVGMVRLGHVCTGCDRRATASRTAATRLSGGFAPTSACQPCSAAPRGSRLRSNPTTSPPRAAYLFHAGRA